jgi:hypothetical protein
MNLSSSNSPGGKGGKFGKSSYDPSRKWGLTPSSGQQNLAASSESAKLGGGATYIVDGRVFSGFDTGGIDADAARLKGLRKKKEEELAIEEIIRKDGGKTPAAQILKKGAAHLKSLNSTGAGTSTSDAPDDQLGTAEEAPKKVYSANLVKSIGFDPSRHSGNSGRPKEGEGMRKVCTPITVSSEAPIPLLSSWSQTWTAQLVWGRLLAPSGYARTSRRILPLLVKRKRKRR